MSITPRSNKRFIITGATEGDNEYHNTKVSHDGNLHVSIENPLDSFGNLISAKTSILLLLPIP